MKLLKIVRITTFVLLLTCILVGCPVEDEITASMTFADDPDSPAKEFTIYENLVFKVVFIDPTPAEQAMTITPGTVISGQITSASAAWNSDLEGIAEKMTSTNPTINIGVSDPSMRVPVSLDYIIDEGKIISVTLGFIGDGMLPNMARDLMGGIYLRK